MPLKDNILSSTFRNDAMSRGILLNEEKQYISPSNIAIYELATLLFVLEVFYNKMKKNK
jgi:hypothetical protein